MIQGSFLGRRDAISANNIEGILRTPSFRSRAQNLFGKNVNGLLNDVETEELATLTAVN